MRGVSLTGLREGTAGAVVGNVMFVVIGNVTITGVGWNVHWAAVWGKAYIAILECGQYDRAGRGEKELEKEGRG